MENFNVKIIYQKIKLIKCFQKNKIFSLILNINFELYSIMYIDFIINFFLTRVSSRKINFNKCKFSKINNYSLNKN
jgi:hypothetical protein